MERKVEMLGTTVTKEVLAKMKLVREKRGVPFGKQIELSLKDSKYFQEMIK